MATKYTPITASTSTSPSPLSTNLDYISRAKQRLYSGLAARRPWRQIFDYHALSWPRNFSESFSRLRTNLSYFRMNFAMFVLLILFLSLLWHPISLIVFIVMMAVWLFLYFLRDEPLVVFGRTIDDRVVLVVLAVLTIVFLLLTHATVNILVSLAVCAVIVVVYSMIRGTDDLFLDEEAAASGGLVARGGLRPVDVSTSSS
ncbi:hypothetical protein Nepgr_023901 [Nepenthes gracilis]|uniref:PRA1 family protein n=1 Tax=Nepenthes gracilis TaxID=150966 RepID=A0AAD3T304_NEPGR|nr:hypothetical protein Nepgr_023901 [Nepenthes gracilis]